MGEKKKQKRAATTAADKASSPPPASDAPNASSSFSGTGRQYTVSIAVPGSVADAAGTLELATAAAGSIARTAAAFCVDEIVVYDDSGITASEDASTSMSVSAGTAFLARVLQYIETPPYLRQELCPPHGDVSLAHTLPPLGTPHHPAQTEWVPYREGVVLRSEAGKGSFVDIGLDRMAYVSQVLQRGQRVTLSVGEQPTTRFMPEFSETMVVAELSAPSVPRSQHGTYWGYRVRMARSLHRVFKECPFKRKDGYDLSIGTSAQGIQRGLADLVLPRFKHALVVFGGQPDGLAQVMEREEPLAHKTPEDQFGMYLNLCPSQGVASVRTEDAVPMALGYLRPALLEYGASPSNA